jgi:hypothetical protein
MIRQYPTRRDILSGLTAAVLTAARTTHHMFQLQRSVLFTVLALFAVPSFLSAQEPKLPPEVKKVAVAEGVELHYVERGKGVPVVFVYGGSVDYSACENHFSPIAESYRAIAYSCRDS